MTADPEMGRTIRHKKAKESHTRFHETMRPLGAFLSIYSFEPLCYSIAQVTGLSIDDGESEDVQCWIKPLLGYMEGIYIHGCPRYPTCTTTKTIK